MGFLAMLSKLASRGSKYKVGADGVEDSSTATASAAEPKPLLGKEKVVPMAIEANSSSYSPLSSSSSISIKATTSTSSSANVESDGGLNTGMKSADNFDTALSNNLDEDGVFQMIDSGDERYCP